MHQRFAAVIAAMLFTTAAVAQDERPLIDLGACRLDAEQVVVSFKFEASPCWEPLEPVYGDTAGDEAALTLPLKQVGEICTMNIVIYEYSKTIPLMTAVRKLDVTVNSPEGALIGTGTAAIAEPGGRCEQPTAVAATQ